MSGYTVTTAFVYTLVSNLRENASMRYVTTVTDGASNEYFATIFDVSSYPVAEGVKYVLSISPIAVYSNTLASQIVYYQVYVNPFTTELITTPISNAIPISFSISKSLIYLFYMNQSFGLQFYCPYTDISGCKQSILNIFSYPCYIVMLYGSFFLQFSYIQTAYEAAITGSYDGNMMTVHNLFDFNSTFVILEKNQPQLYWNSERFSVANQVPYISYSSGNSTSLVVGFTNTYIIQQNGGNYADLMSLVNQSSLNIPSNTASSVGYTSLGSLVPLIPTTPTDGFTFYYLSGVAGQGFSGSQYATIQVVNILNSNNVYQSISAIVVYQASQTTPLTLTQYGSTSLWYNLNLTTNTLTVWQDPVALVFAFTSFVSSNSTTIMTSDMIQLTSDQIDSFYAGMNGMKMGATTVCSSYNKNPKLCSMKGCTYNTDTSTCSSSKM